MIIKTLFFLLVPLFVLGSPLPHSSKDHNLQNILTQSIQKLPKGSQRLIKKGRLGITLVELDHDSTQRKWAAVNGDNVLCGASTLKLFCAVAAFEAEALGLISIHEVPNKPTTSKSISVEDIKGSILYTKGAREGNKQAGRVCAAVNDAYLQSTSQKPLNYKYCFTNDLLREWQLDNGIALGWLYGSGKRCPTSPPFPNYGLGRLSSQRASSNALSSLWTAIELEEFSNITSDRISYFKNLIYGGSKVIGKIGKAFCKKNKSPEKQPCYNKYGKTGTWGSKIHGFNLYCRNDSRVIEYPQDIGKKIILSIVCNSTYDKKTCKHDQTIEKLSQSIKSLMEDHWRK